MTVKKFNYIRFVGFLIIVIGLIVGITLLVKHINYTKTYEYKFKSIGYSDSEISVINTLDNSIKNELLNQKYNEYLVPFASEKYFIYDNLNKYIEYYKQNKYDYAKVVSIINTEANIEWIDNERETDTSKKELMLVNRLYGLNKDFEVEDVVEVPVKYAYYNVKISNSILDNIIDLCESAKTEGYTFVVSNGFRSYKDQQDLYNTYVNDFGKSEADQIVARPGHSEYETGLTFNLEIYGKNYDNEEASEEYVWLKENAHKFGFIFRFPKDKEDITLFNSDLFKLRYVGVDAATIINNEGICFEEYYAYYLRGEK